MSLERARRLEPRNIAILNDLAVARFQMGEREQRLDPMLQALDVIERAVRIDSTDLSVLFNRALVLQRLYLVASAEKAWSRYLAAESNHDWRREAELHRKQLTQSTDTIAWLDFLDANQKSNISLFEIDAGSHQHRSPQSDREFSFSVLQAWGLAHKNDDKSEAASFLKLAKQIATRAKSRGLDQSVGLAIDAIDALKGDDRRLDSLADGHVQFATGVAAYSLGSYDRAARVLETASITLNRLASPMSRWADFYLAATQNNRGAYDAADQLLERVIDQATVAEPALTGKAIWAIGVGEARRGHYEKAAEFYKRAAPYFARAREPENQGAMSYLLAEVLSLAGQSSMARTEAYTGIRLLSPYRRSVFLSNHLTTVGGFARGDGLSYASLAVMDEVVDVARAMEKAQFIALALCSRVRVRIAVGDSADAIRDLNEAQQWVARLEPGRGQDRIEADVKLVLGQVTRRQNPQAALDILAAVTDTYRAFNTSVLVPVALHETALAAEAVGKTDFARANLLAALRQIERQDQAFASTEVRATFYETVENVFDAFIDLELRSGRTASAFNYLERSRSRPWGADASSIPAISSGDSEATIQAVAAALPADAVLIDYALLQNELVAWTISRRNWKHHSIPIQRDSMAGLIESALDEMSGVSGQPARASARLFDLLLKSLQPELTGFRTLIIVPDRELARIPFAALWNARSRRFVLQEFEIRMVPSANFYLAVRSREQSRHRPITALAIGNPAIRPELERELPRLPAAAQEAERVAELYTDSELLTGTRAGHGETLRLLTRHSIFHFAGHAVFNSEQPELSYLALAPDSAANDGLLRAREIGVLRLSNLQIVVLSACSTLGPRSSHAGGIAGLAYSFLRAGAPATVSTLWDVSDAVTSELLVWFHRYYASGIPAAEALHRAQLDALTSSREDLRAPSVWAALTYTGP